MKLKIKEVAIFGMLGGLMYASKVAMASLPNIHLIAVFIVAITLVYHAKALYPTLVYVILEGLFGGFTIWWLPYLYIWPLLCGVVILLPKNMPEKLAVVIYMLVAGLHGLLYGTLYGIGYALLTGLDWNGFIAWVVAGLPYDAIHGAGNFVLGILIVPLTKVLRKLAAQ